MRMLVLPMVLVAAVGCGSRAPGPAPVAAPAPAAGGEVVGNEAPVDVAPTIAVVLILDRSGSMTGPRMEVARDSALVAAAALPGDAHLGVVVFDSEATVVLPLTAAREEGQIRAALAAVTPCGGTNPYPALLQASALLDGVEAEVEHVVYLSDGEAPYDGVVTLVEGMAAQRATFSTIALGGDADRVLLAQMAEAGGGRALHVPEPAQLAEAMREEIARAIRR